MDIIDSKDEDILEHMITDNHISLIYRLLSVTLSAREQEVIILRYGLYGQEAMTQKDVAGRLAISRSYVSRIEKRALEKLRQRLEEG